MTPDEKISNTMLDITVGYMTSWGGLVALGMDVLKAATLGFGGAGGALLFKLLYNKIFKKNK